MISQHCQKIFSESIRDYHTNDHVDTVQNNPYPSSSLDSLLYTKNWIDTVQWHLEDLIRDPSINPTEALQLKRRIDRSNQERTDLVEKIDDWFLEKYKDVKVSETTRLNTESPAWAIDRLSILELKIFHMQIEAERDGASPSHRQSASSKLSILLEQRKDLSRSIDQLIEDIELGKKQMKVYRQMKMYNDASLNPVLYKSGKE